jgi:hypothetical protein
MPKRHEKLGIKQTIQRHWMDRTVQMMLAGMTEKEIRFELDDYLATQKQSGGMGERGRKTYGMAIGILASWFSPENNLISLRDEALFIAKGLPVAEWLPLHWAVISASYPFWFNVARQVGRLLNLQEQITQAQIFSRLKEQYGDRETVARNARYAVRSFVAWNVLRDAETKGCYLKSDPIAVVNDQAVLLLESVLHVVPEAKGTLSLLLNSPAFFPFHIPNMTGDYISQRNNRTEVVRYGLDDELLKLRSD